MSMVKSKITYQTIFIENNYKVVDATEGNDVDFVDATLGC